MGYYNFPHTRNYDTDLGYLIEWFKTNKNKIDENTAITIEKALIATEEANKAYKSATNAADSAVLALELKNQTEALKNLMQDKINQIDTNTNRIDNLATINQGSITTTADAELVDIRVGANGITYPSAGDSVRGQINELKDDLGIISKRIGMEFEINGKLISSFPVEIVSNSITIPANTQLSNNFFCYRIERDELNKYHGKTLYFEFDINDTSEIDKYLIPITYGGKSFEKLCQYRHGSKFMFCIKIPEYVNDNYFSFGIQVYQTHTFETEQTITVNEINSYMCDVANFYKFVENVSINQSPIYDKYVTAFNGASVSDSSLVVPAGQTAHNSILGVRITNAIESCKGKLIDFELTIVDSLTNQFSVIILQNGNKTCNLISSNILSNYVSAKVEIPNDYNGTYLVIGVQVKGDLSFNSEKIYTITKYDCFIDVTGIKEVLDHTFSTKDKLLFTFGHSMTHMQTWQNTVVDRLLLRGYEIKAVYGGTLTNGYKEIENTPENIDYVTVWYDTNDWKTNVLLGSITDSTENPTTFIGALKYVCEWLSKNRPNAEVILVSSPKRFDSDSEAMGVTYGRDNHGYSLNANGNTLEDFANAINEVGDMYSFKKCDLFHNSGINKQNASTFLASDLLHPNSVGGVRIGNMIAKVIN